MRPMPTHTFLFHSSMAIHAEAVDGPVLLTRQQVVQLQGTLPAQKLSALSCRGRAFTPRQPLPTSLDMPACACSGSEPVSPHQHLLKVPLLGSRCMLEASSMSHNITHRTGRCIIPRLGLVCLPALSHASHRHLPGHSTGAEPSHNRPQNLSLRLTR